MTLSLWKKPPKSPLSGGLANCYFLLCVLVLMLGGTQVCTVFATAPTTAKIAFTSKDDGNLEVYTMDPDGSKQVNLTWHASRDFDPVWSPTGEHIAFTSNRDGIHDIYLMEADGKRVRKVFRSSARRECPTWSRDGQWIAYLSLNAGDWGIYISTIDGKQTELVVSPGFLGGCPAWSPDGSEIAFVSAADPARRLLKVINLQTREERVLVPNQAPRTLWGPPAWSPDGTRIAFYWSRKGIYVVNNNGEGLKRLISNAIYPARSPLGDELIYRKNSQLFIRNFGNRTSRQITHGVLNGNPDWFDPQLLPVQPQASLLTTTWAAIKHR